MDANLHLKITDFGTARILEKGKDMIVDNSDIQKRPSKQTFCGTANYVSPVSISHYLPPLNNAVYLFPLTNKYHFVSLMQEMLNNGPCKIGSDLWALGCIIYQFLTGVHIFTGDSDYLIFQKILNRQIDFPESFPPAAKNLIQELLQLNPDDRLGAKAEGYKELKAHPFFNGIDWNNLHNQLPPRIKPEVQLATIQPKDAAKWNLFLLKNEKIAFSSLVIKRRRMTSKKRQLILTDRPRFFYVDETKMSLKGFIPWSKDIRVVVKSSKDFIIQTPTRKYVMEDQFNNADQWAKCVNAMLSSSI